MKNMRLNKKMIIIFTLLIIAGVFWGLQSKQSSDAIETLADKENVEYVNAEEIISGAIEEKLFTIGSVDPLSTFVVNAKVNGEVKSTFFEKGDRVKKGDVLFEIEKENYLVTKNATLNQLRNALDQSELALNQAEENYRHQMSLFNAGAVSQAALDAAKMTLDNSKIAYNNASTNLNSNISSLNEQLDFYIQRSPVDGVIVEKNISVANFASTQNSYTIVPENQYVLNSSVTSKYVSKIEKGQKAYIYVNTLDRYYEGEVLSISRVGKKGVYPVEIAIYGDEELMAGLYAEVNIVINSLDAALLAPSEAIVRELEEAYIYIVNEDSNVEKIKVELGIESGGWVQIICSISKGSKVVTKGKEFISNQTKVVIK